MINKFTENSKGKTQPKKKIHIKHKKRNVKKCITIKGQQ